MHFHAQKLFSEKNRLFLKKSSVRFFQKQPVFFRKRPPHEKMHIYAVSGEPVVLIAAPLTSHLSSPLHAH
jgi:hypothetical protein